MSAGNYTLYIEQGASFEILLTLKDGDGAEINLTNHTFRGSIRKTATTNALIDSFNFEKGNQTTNTGEVRVYLSATETAALPVDRNNSSIKELTKYVYDIESELGDGTVYRWIEGVCEISPEVTR